MMKAATTLAAAIAAATSTLPSITSAQQSMPMSMSMITTIERPPLVTTEEEDDVVPDIDVTLPPGACVCSPRSYSFQLNFRGGCNDETYMDNTGIEGSLCFFTQGNSPEDVADGNVGVPGIGRRRISTQQQLRRLRRGGGGSNEEDSEFGRQVPTVVVEDTTTNNNVIVLSSSTTIKNLDIAKAMFLRDMATTSFASHYKHAIKVMAAESSSTSPSDQDPDHRFLQGAADFDTQVTSVTSVTFLEFDADFNDIIHQDSEYFETSFTNGDVITYESISSRLNVNEPLDTQANLVPGGVMLVLFGPNSSGTVVQNTVVWGYELTNCETVPVNNGDKIGWTTLQSNKSPRAEFCGGVTNYPTAFPSATPTTGVPSGSPTITITDEPTPKATTYSPTMDPLTEAPTSEAPTTESPVVFEKSEITASPVVAKSAKAKSAKCGSKSGKGSKNSSSSDCLSMSMVHDINKPYVMFTKGSKMFHETTSGQIQVPRPSGKATKLFKHGVKTSKIGTTAADRPEGLTTSSSKAYKTSLISKAEKGNSEMYLGFHTQNTGSMSMAAEVEAESPEGESTAVPVSSTDLTTPGSPTLPPAVVDAPVASSSTVSSTPTFSPTSSTPPVVASPIAATTDAPVASLTNAPTDAVATPFPTSSIEVPPFPAPVAGETPAPTLQVTGTDPTDAPTPPVTSLSTSASTVKDTSPAPSRLGTTPPTDMKIVTDTSEGAVQVAERPPLDNTATRPPLVKEGNASPTYAPTEWYPTYSPVKSDGSRNIPVPATSAPAPMPAYMQAMHAWMAPDNKDGSV